MLSISRNRYRILHVVFVFMFTVQSYNTPQIADPPLLLTFPLLYCGKRGRKDGHRQQLMTWCFSMEHKTMETLKVNDFYLKRYLANVVVCKICSVLWVLEQPRVYNSIVVPLKHGAHLGAVGSIYLRPALIAILERNM